MATSVIVDDQPWFNFEVNYPETHLSVRQWTVEHRHFSVIFGIVYLCLVYIGRRIMLNRQPFVIRGALASWNALMFLVSITICVRLSAYSLWRAFYKSLYSQVCESEFEALPLVLWLDIFVLSKPIEFTDTLFIVLRKQPLHFLHWYHHCTVVILCWYSLGIAPAPPNALYYAAMNSFIHTIMYLYYFLRALQFTLPRPIQMSVTGLQIVQMAIGCFLNISALIYRLHYGVHCDAAMESILLALGIYLCYFILFADYFRKAYFSSRLPSAHQEKNHRKHQMNTKKPRKESSTSNQLPSARLRTEKEDMMAVQFRSRGLT